MRQAGPVRSQFATGVETWLDLIDAAMDAHAPMPAGQRRAKVIELAARAVGAIVLARASGADPRLSAEILETSLTSALAAAAAE